MNPHEAGFLVHLLKWVLENVLDVTFLSDVVVWGPHYMTQHSEFHFEGVDPRHYTSVRFFVKDLSHDCLDPPAYKLWPSDTFSEAGMVRVPASDSWSRYFKDQKRIHGCVFLPSSTSSMFCAVFFPRLSAKGVYHVISWIIRERIKARKIKRNH